MVSILALGRFLIFFLGRTKHRPFSPRRPIVLAFLSFSARGATASRPFYFPSWRSRPKSLGQYRVLPPVVQSSSRPSTQATPRRPSSSRARLEVRSSRCFEASPRNFSSPSSIPRVEATKPVSASFITEISRSLLPHLHGRDLSTPEELASAPIGLRPKHQFQFSRGLVLPTHAASVSHHPTTYGSSPIATSLANNTDPTLTARNGQHQIMAAVAPMDLVVVRSDPVSIPLQCTLCPKKPRFSDLSHLLTHIPPRAISPTASRPN